MEKVLQSIALKIIALEKVLNKKMISDEKIEYFNRHAKYISETIEEIAEIIDTTSDLGDICQVGRALLMISGKLGDCKNDFEDLANIVDQIVYQLDFRVRPLQKQRP